MNNKNYSITLKTNFNGKNIIYITIDDSFTEKVFVSVNNNFLKVNNYSFHIMQTPEKKFELFINELKFTDLEQNKKIIDNKPITNNNFNNEIKYNNSIFNPSKTINVKIKQNNINSISNNNFIENIDELNNINEIQKPYILRNFQKTRNKKSKLKYQSSDELIKKAMNNYEKSNKNTLSNYDTNNRNFKSNLPLFADHLPKSLYHVYQYKNKNMPKICAVCLDNFLIGQEILTLPCFHFFHCNCISKWLKVKRICPICLSSINS